MTEKVDMRVASDVDVIAALRVAEAATEDYDAFGQVAMKILEVARDTPAENVGGLQLLLRLQREGAFAFKVGD